VDLLTNKGFLTAAALAAVVLFLILRNLALTSPVMAGDEYAYYAAAKVFPNSSVAHVNDPLLQKIYSPLFTGLGHLFFMVSATPEALMKVVNSTAFGLTALLFAALLWGLDVSPRLQNLGLGLFLVVPLSSYTAYFMPETTYALLFWSLTVAIVFLVPGYTRLGAIVAGGFVGALLLTKPHALAMFFSVIATFAALALAPTSIRPSKRELLSAGVLFTLATYFAMVGLNGLLSRHLDLHPLAFVGAFYRPHLTRGFALSLSWERMWQFLTIAAGHIVLLAVFVTPAVVLSVTWIRDLCSGEAWGEDGGKLQRLRLFVLIAFTLSATALTLAMTVHFTLQVAQLIPTELQRLHGRYYSFIIPLYLAIYLWLVEGVNGRPRLIRHNRLGGFLGVLGAIGMFFVYTKNNIYPWDYPEAFVFSNWHGQAWLAKLAIGVAVAAYTFVFCRGPAFKAGYVTFLAFVWIASNLTVMQWQFEHSRRYGALAESARALKSLIPPTDAMRAIIVGSDRWGLTSYYLFGMMAAPGKVIIRPAGSRLTQGDLNKDTKWVILTDQYDIGFPVEVSLATGRIWLGRTARGDGPALHENVRMWSGKPLSYSFGTGRSSEMLQGFNDPEPWGVWSAVDGARIILPEMITGAVEIRVDGWTVRENLSQPLELRIGDARAPLKLSDRREIASVLLEVDGYHREISLSGLKPYRKHVWERPQGVALVRLEVHRVRSRGPGK
jgi:phosphoglycerol transferase